jgi:hypothetical protein
MTVKESVNIGLLFDGNDPTGQIYHVNYGHNIFNEIPHSGELTLISHQQDFFPAANSLLPNPQLEVQILKDNLLKKKKFLNAKERDFTFNQQNIVDDDTIII